MARFQGDARVQPWPEHHPCDDGKTRSLAVFIADEWRDHPDVRDGRPGGHASGSDQAGAFVWLSHRLRIAGSLGRADWALNVIARMAGRGPRRKSPFQ